MDKIKHYHNTYTLKREGMYLKPYSQAEIISLNHYFEFKKG